MLEDDPNFAASLYGLRGFDNFRIIEDRHIETLIRERNLLDAGLIAKDSAVELGQLSGANFLAETFYRFFSDPSRSIRMEVTKKIFDLETGTLVGFDLIRTSPQ